MSPIELIPLLLTGIMESVSPLPSAARRLEGKVALITGGASGIGECTARLFCRHGAKVVIADVQDEKGHSVCQDIGPSAASYVHCDVTDESDVKLAVDTAVATHGKLDIMFNNAGIYGDPGVQILKTEKSNFERVMSINVLGAFLGTKHAARVMIPARRGCIITTASVASLFGGVTSYAYTCSKHAVLGIARNAATELGQHGIRVNCVSPYVLVTPLARKGFGTDDDREIEEYTKTHTSLKETTLTTEDIAEAALYLASNESKYVNGHNLVVDGGFTVANCSFLDFKD